MKTTIDLPDELVRQVKALAGREGVTLRELMVEGLRGELERRARPAPRPDFVFRTAPGDGLAPEVDPATVIERSYGLRS